MLRLRTLGTLSITDDEVPIGGAAARRRSLALLALAASSGEAGVSDERALALLWPDFDSANARNNLKQVAFTLRQAIRRDVFIRNAGTLRLDPSIISVDRWDFERAVVVGDAPKAVSLYSGPFLSGFHIRGLAEFERWTDAERERLGRVFTDALTRLASDAEADGDHPRAIAWWRRLVTEDPLSDANAQRLIRALAASGDIAGALQHARLHETLLTQDLDAKPSPAFQRFVQDIRAGITPVNEPARTVRRTTPPFAVQAITMGASVRPEPSPTPANGTNGLELTGSAAPSRDTATAPLARSANRTTPSRSRRAWHTAERRIAGFTTRFTTAAAALIVVATIAVFIVRNNVPAFAKNSESGSAVVVLPFNVNTVSSPGNFGAVLSELLAAALDGSLGLRAIAVGGTERKADSARIESPVARRVRARRLATSLGADLYVSGEVFESGDRMRITAEFSDRGDELPVGRAQVEGTRSELFDLIDRVASQLLASRVDVGRRDVLRVASVTTTSLPAAKAYFLGEAALAAGRFRAAIDSYQEAVQLDPTFALAFYGLSNAADMIDDDDLVQRSASQALRHSERLPSRQKRLLGAFLSRQQGDVVGAKRLYSQLTDDYPADAEAWLGLGETLFHLNPLIGQPATEADIAFERAAALDPKNTGAFVHLARIAAIGGDEDRSRRMVARARALAPEPAVARFALHVLSLGVPLDDAANGRTPRAGTVTALPAADAVALLSRSGEDAMLRFAKRLSTAGDREYGLRLQSIVEASHGRVVNAMALLDTCSTANRNLAIEARSRLAVLSFIPLGPADIDRVRSELITWSQGTHEIDQRIDSIAHIAAHPFLRFHRLGLLALRVNDTTALKVVSKHLDSLAKASPANTSGQLLATSLRAHIASVSGHSREALAMLEGDMATRLASATALEAYDRLLRAQLLEKLGRDDEALGYYSQLGAGSPFELVLVWQAELGMARIHAKRGDRSLAARYYRSVVTRLSNADGSLLAVRDEAERLATSLTSR